MVWLKPLHKSTDVFVDPEFQEAFQPDHYLNFNSLWMMQFNNHHRVDYPQPGSNLITRFDLPAPEGESQGFYLKRQLELTGRSMYAPMGESLFAQELRTMLLCQQRDIPSLEPVYYCQHLTAKGLAAILIIRALDGYKSVHDYLHQWDELEPVEQDKLVSATARLLAKIHTAGFRQKNIAPESFIIDWQQIPQVRQANPVDLSEARMNERRTLAELKLFLGQCEAWSFDQKLQFIETYCESRSMMNSPNSILRHCLNR